MKPPPKPERVIQKEVRLAAAAKGYTLWRNNVGTGWQGKRINARSCTVTLRDGTRTTLSDVVILENPRPVKFGLCEGMTDLVGIRPVTITQNMVGQTIAQFAGLEIKRPGGRVLKKQRGLIKFLVDSGAIADIVKGPEEVP